jgi:ComF family protein
MSNYPQRVANWVLDIIFPKICLGCGKLIGKGDFDYVCKKCFGKVSVKNSFECIGCKRQTRLGLTCVLCQKENPIGQLLIAAELSDFLVEKMLKVYKYKFVYNMAVPLSVIAKKCIRKLLSRSFNVFGDSPLIIPVPLHIRRLNWRGFNQAELLAKNIADTYHMPYDGNILIKIVNSKHQANIRPKEERIDNVKGSFAVIESETVKNRTIILVDDICTTGATLNECAKILKEGGAKRIIGFVIARG